MHKVTIYISLLLFSLKAIAQDAQQLYSEGLELKRSGKKEDAIKKFADAVLLKPGFTEARYEWAWCQNDLGAYSGAIDNLRLVRDEWKTVPKVYFELGYAFQKYAMTDSAISSYKRCLELKPDYAGAYRQLGYIAYDKDDNAATLDYFDKFIKASKDEIKDYLFWYRKGYTENAQKKYSDAKTDLLNSLKYKTDYLNTYLELGFCCTRMRQDEEAISYFQKAIEIDPKSHIPYNGIAEVYRDNKRDMEKAKEWYQKTLTINANERKANFGMGFCLNSQKRYSEAIPYLKKAIESEKTYTAAYVEYGYALYKTGNNTDAISNFNKALELNSRNENARYYAVLVYVSQKNKIMAQKMVDELKALSSKYADELQTKVNQMQ